MNAVVFVKLINLEFWVTLYDKQKRTFYQVYGNQLHIG